MQFKEINCTVQVKLRSVSPFRWWWWNRWHHHASWLAPIIDKVALGHVCPSLVSINPPLLHPHPFPYRWCYIALECGRIFQFPLHHSPHTCGATTLLGQLRPWRCWWNTPNVVTIYQLSQNIPKHLNLHLVQRIRMCRALPPTPMYFHGTRARVPLLYQHVSVICLQLTGDHHIKMYVAAVTIIREFAGAWKKPLGRKNTCNKYHTCKVSLQYEFVGEQLIHP